MKSFGLVSVVKLVFVCVCVCVQSVESCLRAKHWTGLQRARYNSPEVNIVELVEKNEGGEQIEFVIRIDLSNQKSLQRMLKLFSSNNA